MSTKRYKASLDSVAFGMTMGVIALFGYIITSTTIFPFFEEPLFSPTVKEYGVSVLLLGILLLSYAFSPRSYSLTSTELIIHRLIGKKRISFSNINSTQQLSKNALHFFKTIRTFGVGGLFGYYGQFYNSTFGHMTVYATQRKNMVMIFTKDGGQIVISPNDEDFLEDLNAHLGQSAKE